eukprot:CAMPEP_0114159718 /NCGR_PEP_ID=MMETSP0043_2-20121206/27939_1 /TAXON_ID=464988 /ORGANISM="Hemiselmis andersenii, Strain CCMP644" /LENGTH=76 /DNA_ID=CAMNT_0001255641 /DNA_START=269 /DNA_END=499 /DNA_ORIENTATION=-
MGSPMQGPVQPGSKWGSSVCLSEPVNRVEPVNLYSDLLSLRPKDGLAGLSTHPMRQCDSASQMINQSADTTSQLGS